MFLRFSIRQKVRHLGGLAYRESQYIEGLPLGSFERHPRNVVFRPPKFGIGFKLLKSCSCVCMLLFVDQLCHRPIIGTVPMPGDCKVLSVRILDMPRLFIFTPLSYKYKRCNRAVVSSSKENSSNRPSPNQIHRPERLTHTRRENWSYVKILTKVLRSVFSWAIYEHTATNRTPSSGTFAERGLC